MVQKHNTFLGTYCTELELISLTLYPPVLLLLTVTKTVDSMVQELFIVNLTSCQNLFNHCSAKKKKKKLYSIVIVQLLQMKRELSLYTRPIQNEQFFFLNQVHYVAHKSDENLKKKKKQQAHELYLFLFFIDKLYILHAVYL